MAYDPGAISSTLAAALGDEPGLILEMRFAFLESARRAVASLAAAHDDAAWRAAAYRLEGLAASFGAVRLMAMARAAADAAMDPAVLSRLARAIDRL